ncbi:MAG: Fe-S cluster protein [Nitrosopumilus sp. BACL13 MAG-121220-bin23]|jgi:nitrogen fixation protein NifU and related proteins|nr:MAG: Fe-S cluster protein [Nitrosopumilus sp. BACL13 MAG-121220-bin23]KRO30530.1 MAG: Fe-S cluster protein [Nitrosopumilus sp. BACL13 MAG-120910-bin56]
MSGTDIYHEMIVDYSRNPLNYGEIENHDVTFHDSNPLCGDSIDIDMKIDDNKVTDIKFHGKGCAICMACTSVLTEITKGKSLDDVRKIEKHDVLGELGLDHLQAVRIKCALLSLKVLKSALYTYIGSNLDAETDVDTLKTEAENLY